MRSRSKILAVVIAAGAVLVWAPSALAGAPANDLFANAATIDPSALPFSDVLDNTEATIETGEGTGSCGTPRQTVWYRLMPVTQMAITIDMDGSSFPDTSLGVFRGFGGIDSLIVENCAHLGARITLALRPFETYYIQAGDVNGAGGQLHLNVTRIPPPTNDAFTDARVITSVPFSDSLDPLSATTEPLEPGGCDFSTGGTVWYSYTPSVDGTVQASIDSALFDPGMASAYVGTLLPSLSLVGCKSFFGTSLPLTFHATAGTTYYFQARPLSSTARTLTFGLKFLADGPPAVANDNLDGAKIIGSLPYNDVVDNTQATTEIGEPTWCGPTNQTVWFAFTPASNMVIRADTSGSNFADSELGAYAQNGSGFGGLSFLGCVFNGNPIQFQAQAGRTYYFQAGSFHLAGGMLHFNVEVVPGPLNDDWTHAAPITALPFSHVLDLGGATTEPGEPNPSCGFPARGTAWYAFTPPVGGTYTGGLTSSTPFTFVVEYGVYTGSSLGTLTQTACNYGNPLEFHAEGGKTYYIQVGNGGGLANVATFSLRIRDATPPVITPTVTGTPGSNGWYVSDVTVAWTVQDPESPVSSQSGCGPTTVSTDTVGTTFTCSATSAGGTASQSVSVKRDATAPAVSCAATPNVLWPPNNQLIAVETTVGLTDELSGPDGFTLVATGANEGTPALDIVDWTIGTADTTGTLRAARSGMASDRTYSLTYRGSDQAGNAALCTATATVPHDERP